VYEGRSACWMLDNVLTHPLCQTVLVDNKIQDNGWKNLERHAARFDTYLGDSKVILPRMCGEFDIIYIDGDHSAKGALFDSVACWPRLKVGGIMLWDDYRRFEPEYGVWIAVNRFCECLNNKDFRVVLDNYQYAVEKLRL